MSHNKPRAAQKNASARNPLMKPFLCSYEKAAKQETRDDGGTKAYSDRKDPI
jgi:hypothetical protein